MESFTEKLADFIIIINAKQVLKSIKIYLIKHKVTFTSVYHSKYIVNIVLGIKRQPLEFKTSLTARLHIGNSHYCLCDSGFVNQIKIIILSRIK